MDNFLHHSKVFALQHQNVDPEHLQGPRKLGKRHSVSKPHDSTAQRGGRNRELASMIISLITV